MKAKLCIDQACPRKGVKLKLTEFPKNRSRPDGRHVYCRECVLRRTHEYRARKRAMKAAQKPFRDLRRKSMVIVQKVDDAAANEKVLQAIRQGARTRVEIKRSAGLCWDALTNSLAILCFDSRSIRIKRVGQEAYFEVAA